jgi:hypothetical protein
MLIFVVRFGCKLKFAFFALGAQARNPLFWQSQCGPQAPYGVYFCFLSCPGTLPTLLRVLVGFDCVYVVHITRTKLKFAFFAVGAQAKIRYFGSLSVAPRPPTVTIFVSYHAQAPYQQC